MATNYHSMPPPGVTATTNLDYRCPKGITPQARSTQRLDQSTELFTIFGQATAEGIAKVSGMKKYTASIPVR